MAELTVDMTYGSALYQAASETGNTQLVLDESRELLGILAREPEFLALLHNPTVSAGEKKRVIQAVFHGRICQELENLLMILVDKRRTRHLERILSTYKKLMDKEQGISYGKILSPRPLGPETIAAFEKEAGKLLKVRVSLQNETDSTLIGGVRIYVDGKVFDASLRTRLQDLYNTMK